MQYHHIHSSDPVARVRKVEGIIEVLSEHCQSEAEKISDPEAKALFESTANELGALTLNFQNYLEKVHAPWERFEDTIPQKSIDPWD